MSQTENSLEKEENKMRIRIYGKILEVWTAEDARGREITTQTEIAYREYDSETGELLGSGSEDFSPARERSEIDCRWIWTWDGDRRNKGGKRWFECHGMIKYRKREKSEVKRYLENKYNSAALELR